MIDFKIDATGILRVGETLEYAAKHTRRSLIGRLASMAVRHVKNLSEESPVGNPRRDVLSPERSQSRFGGPLHKSFYYTRAGDYEYSIGTTEEKKYTYVTKGTAPHAILPGIMYGREHKKALWWPDLGWGNYIVGGVSHPGTKANPFDVEAAEKTESAIQRLYVEPTLLDVEYYSSMLRR